MKLVTALLDLNELQLLESNTYDIVEIDRLADNIEAVGLITALTVSPAENGKYEIVSGARRYTAIQKLKSENRLPDLLKLGIPCYIKEYKTDFEKKLDMEFANLEVRDLGNSKAVHEFNVAKLIAENKDNPLSNAKNIEEKLGKSSRYIRALKSIIASENEELINTTAEHGNVMLAAQVSQMDEESQNQYVEKIKEGATAKAAFKEVKNNNASNNNPVIKEDTESSKDDIFSDLNDGDDWEKIVEEVDNNEDYFDRIFSGETEKENTSVERESFENKIINWIDVRMDLWESDDDIDEDDQEVIEKMRELINMVDNM